jgi:hypothetical protein
MRYAVILTKDKELYKIYDTIEQAEKKSNKLTKENKNNEVIPIPSEFKAGLKLYKNGIYKKTIVEETKTLFMLNNTENMEFIPDPVLKDNLINYFVRGYFTCDYEDYDEKYVNCVHIVNEEDIKVNFEEEEN